MVFFLLEFLGKKKIEKKKKKFTLGWKKEITKLFITRENHDIIKF